MQNPVRYLRATIRKPTYEDLLAIIYYSNPQHLVKEEATLCQEEVNALSRGRLNRIKRVYGFLPTLISSLFNEIHQNLSRS